MSNERTAKLVRSLYEKTIHGELNWEETADASEFQVSFSNHSILICETPTEGILASSQPPQYVIKILNDVGATIEVIDKDDLDKFIEQPQGLLEAMYDNIRRKAMGVDDAIDSIQNELDGPPF